MKLLIKTQTVLKPESNGTEPQSEPEGEPGRSEMDDCDIPNNCEQNDQGDSGDSGQFSESPNENNYKVHQPHVLGFGLHRVRSCDISWS